MALTRPFTEPTTLAEAGGKAVNLSRLTRAGFPVPPGFVVTTDAFRAALAAPRLHHAVDDALAALDPDDGASADAASAAIRSAFTDVPAREVLTEPVAAAVLAAYRQLGRGAVAVRSSATAEDLPDLSFAGQQDTFLGVEEEEALLGAVAACWASLWTARALTYRRRAGIPEDAAALAVAVQRLVPADTAGVLFTADPVTGHRGRMVVDATFGLGEALVSGQVEPDHYLADAATGHVLERTLGAKAVATRTRPGGGVTTDPEDHRGDATLDDADVRALVALGRRVQDEYGTPQDVEWAITDGTVHLLQARAVTSLHPVPEGVPADAAYLSFGAVQGMLTPMTPLGRDAIRCVLTGGARVFGAHLDPAHNPYLAEAGERLWIRVDVILRNPVGRRLLPGVLGAVDPSARQILLRLRDEGLFDPAPPSVLLPLLPRVARFARTAGRHAVRALRDPAAVRTEFDAVTDALVARAAADLDRAATEPDPRRRAAARAEVLRRSVTDAFPAIVPYAGVLVAGPVLALRVLTRLSHATDEADHGISPLVLEVTRALPHNVTTEMDLALWRVASEVAADPDARRAVATTTPGELADAYASGSLPPAVATALAPFLDRYGMRGVGEIDLGRPRWRDDPTDVIATVQRYLEIPDAESPPRQFARGQQASEAAVTTLAERARGLRGRLVRLLAGRVRVLAGARELPKFTVVRLLGLARTALLASGADLVAAGVLDAPDDVFFLRLDELERLGGSADLAVDAAGTLRERVATRRAAHAREARRAQVPRVLVGDGRAYLEGLGDPSDDAAALVGSPVSPGVAEGLVRVVTDPARSDLRHGEVLVCVGTDPAWTPLFLSAAGLVTEVGGMMTHGSVVAREYGIPAVVGVHQATTRLRTGQRVRVDGAAGTVLVLDDEEPADRAPAPTAAPVAAGR